MRAISACILFAGLTQAIQVYLHPLPLVPQTLLPQHANVVISHHLGVELFESWGDYAEFYSGEESFVGEGTRNGLLLTIDEADAEYVLPNTLKVALSIPDDPPVTSLSSVVSTYLHRAPHVYTSIFSGLSSPPRAVSRVLDLFSVSSPATDLFISELSTLSAFVDDPSSSKFAALELQGLSALADTYGRSSAHYGLGAETTRAFLSSVLADGTRTHVALLTFPAGRGVSDKRADTTNQQPPQSPLPVPPPNPQEPIGSISTCFSSAEVCTNATDTCSGRGQCVEASKAGRTCFVCSCRKIVSEQGKSQTWVGEKCERKDISGPFVLLAGTGVALILLIGGAISLLASIGEQQLPSLLLAGVGGARKD